MEGERRTPLRIPNHPRRGLIQMTGQKNLNDQLKSKIDEIDLDAKLSQLAETAGTVLAQAKVQAGSLVHENRAKVDEIIEKATAAIDEKTEGKYHDKVVKAKASFATGLDRIAEARGADQSGAADDSSAGEWTVDEGSMHVGEETSKASTATPAESVTDAGDSTVRPDSAPEVDATDVSEARLTESAQEPRDPHDPQAWANETDRLS